MESSLPAAEADFSIELTFLPVFNLALQQNAFPVISELKLKNNLGRNLVGIDCEFSFSRRKPSMLKSWKTAANCRCANWESNWTIRFWLPSPKR